MKGMSAAIVLMAMTTASVAEIRCQGAPGREQHGAFWSWREIEGKRCWFIRVGGGMPPKSAFTWAKEEPADEPTVKRAQDVTPAPEKTNIEPSIRVRMLRVKPVNPDQLSDGRPNWVGDLPAN